MNPHQLIDILRERMKEKIVKAESEWKKQLTPEEFMLLRKGGTEPPFSGRFWNLKDKGIYVCAGCGSELFSSDTKFDSGTGWPSFNAPVSEISVEIAPDNRFRMRRTEVLCAKCGGHLGHVFNDGPRPSGLRYCINSGALHFKESRNEKKTD